MCVVFISDTVDEDDDLYDFVEDEENEGDEIYEDLMRTDEPPEAVSDKLQLLVLWCIYHHKYILDRSKKVLWFDTQHVFIFFSYLI